MTSFYNIINLQIQLKHVILFLIILIILILCFYNYYYSQKDSKINRINKEKPINKNINYYPIKEFIPMPTRCCPDTLYSTKLNKYIFTPKKLNNQLYNIYQDNPWTYYKNPYLEDDIYKINRKEGPILPDRINYPSQYDNCEFKQVGVISKINDIECNDKCQSNTDIMPLYAKPSKYNRNNYNYYTTNNGNQNLNLQVPIEFKQKNCMEDNGCNEIYDNDIIHVPVFNNNYKVTMYPRN